MPFVGVVLLKRGGAKNYAYNSEPPLRKSWIRPCSTICIKKSNEQKQRIDSELVALSQEVDKSIKEIASLKQKADEVDARMKDMEERREKSMDNLQK